MKIRVGVVGLGYWGPNFVRNFIKCNSSHVVWGCDLVQSNLNRIHQLYPHIKLTKNYSDLLQDDGVDLVTIATPPETHYQLAKKALMKNKHVLVTKPLTTKFVFAQELTQLAKEKKLLLHCDSTYLYTPAVKSIKDAIKKGVIGRPLYYDSVRSNLGIIQKNVNVIWDLAPHDLSILDYCFNLKPLKVLVSASKLLENYTKEELAHITIIYSDNFVAHIHISWISPAKLRTILIGGNKKMILFDDLDPIQKVKIFNKNITLPNQSNFFKPFYKEGGVEIPKLKTEEALFTEINDVVNKINSGKIDYYNADLNTNIVNILENCDESLKYRRWVPIR